MNMFTVTINRDAFIMVDAEQLLQCKLNHARKILKLSKQFSNADEIQSNYEALEAALQSVRDQFGKYPNIIKKANRIFTDYAII